MSTDFIHFKCAAEALQELESQHGFELSRQRDFVDGARDVFDLLDDLRGHKPRRHKHMSEVNFRKH